MFGLLALTLVLPGVPQPGNPLARVSVRVRDAAGLAALRGFDVVAQSPGEPGSACTVELLARRADVVALRALGFAPKVIEADAEAAGRRALESGGATIAATLDVPPGFAQGAMGGYYTFAETVALLDHYAQAYPQIVAPKVSIGTSIQGRPLYAVKVSDHPTQSEAEPRILVDALHHAREPMALETLLLFMHRLVSGYGVDPETTALVDHREIWFVPCVNPDGYVFNEVNSPKGGGLWRKNRRPLGSCVGVDLNRNYPFQWGADDFGSSPNPCEESYRGGAPLSEPETAAIDAFAAAQGFAMMASLHSHGRQIMFPFGYAASWPANVAAYDEHGEEMAAADGYLMGSVADVLGVANGNYLDHFHANRGAEAWAFEIGTAFWPPAAEILPLAEANVEPLMALIRYAGGYARPIAIAVHDGAAGNGFADPGETVDLELNVRNPGERATAGPIAVAVSSSDPDVVVTKGAATIAPLGPLASATTGAALQLKVAAGCEPGHRAMLDCACSFDGFSVHASLPLDVGTQRRIGRDDLEGDLGWIAGLPGDTAFSGRWTRADPIGIPQGLHLSQPEDDATAGEGVRCFVTGNAGTAAGQDDVDDGFTTLLSPAFDLSSAVHPHLRYQRWYWCSQADSPLEVSLSNDGGASWTPLESIGGRPDEWRTSSFRLEDVLPLTDRMRLKVVAQDPANTSVVEALIDELELIDFGAAPNLFAMGRPRIGGTIELQIAAKPGATAFLFAAAAKGHAIVPGVAGALGLSPAGLVFAGSVPVGSAGFVRIKVALPPQPSLIGQTGYAQIAATGAPPAWSNVAAITLE